MMDTTLWSRVPLDVLSAIFENTNVGLGASLPLCHPDSLQHIHRLRERSLACS